MNEIEAHNAGESDAEARGIGNNHSANPLRRIRAWWREPHFLEKNTIIGCTLLVIELILVQPDSPGQMLFALSWLALVAALPFAKRQLCVAGPVLLLAASMLPAQGWWTTGGTALVMVFLAIGFVMPKWAAIALPVAYSVIDAIGFVWLGARASIGGDMIQSAIDALNDLEGDGKTPTPADVALPQYSLIVFVATAVLNLMVLGFLVMFGSAFRRTAEADERAARTERMLGRITREQELAHMIHDSVANDMSTIAMLAWRAKTVDDDQAMLDAIYARSHHALDRVHEVIDVLNGKRELDELDGTGGADGTGINDAAVAATTFDMQMEKYVEDQDRAMAMLGLAGISRFNSVPDVAVPEPARRTVMGLLEEIYANIVRHCAMDGHGASEASGASEVPGTVGEWEEPAYSLFVDIARDRIRISEVNALADESRTLVHGRRHGGGLALHRAAVEALGGVLNTSRQDGTWTLSAEIPLA